MGKLESQIAEMGVDITDVRCSMDVNVAILKARCAYLRKIQNHFLSKYSYYFCFCSSLLASSQVHLEYKLDFNTYAVLFFETINIKIYKPQLIT